eukprot:TRINITY_DN29940_c0_g1_i1.p1 TRINITY_DN29940_c0_g1~~TRINITY_DN29940_c0_g1_i1.p1  ORF type:complete len:359 (+),score=158.76 TRINITY_DN29940_c0_g1_i1:66-1142(+)
MLQTRAQYETKKKESGFFGKMLKKMDGCDIDLVFNGKKPEDKVPIDDRRDRSINMMYYFQHDEPVEGHFMLNPKGKLAHQGVIIEFIGTVQIFTDKEELYEFFYADKHFQKEGGTISAPMKLDFKFDKLKENESYRGLRANVYYTLRLKIKKSIMDINYKEDIWVDRIIPEFQTLSDRSKDKAYDRETNLSGKPGSEGMQVGVEDKLHIEFRYEKKTFHTRECIVGQVGFKVTKLDLHTGEVALVRKEYIGPQGPNQTFESETLQKFEIMDGLPVPGEVVPIRLYLNSIPNVTPSYVPHVENLFHVKYFLNLVLVTTEGRRYFKQQEVTLYRREGGQKGPSPMNIDVETVAADRRDRA